MSTFGPEIINRFPSQSPIHNSDNPGHILIDEGVGQGLDDTLAQLRINSDARFLDTAKGIFLNRFGDWFGLPRGNLTDSEYRLKLKALRGSNISIAGVHGALSIILDLNPNDISIKNSDEGCCRLGKIVLSDQYHPNIGCKLTTQYKRDVGTIEITVPIGTDISLAETVIDQMVLPGVLVVWVEA